MPAVSNSGPFNGTTAPIPISGVNGLTIPHWASIQQAVLTTTATRLYFIPFYFPRAGLAYSGLKSRNTGAGDNGDTYRQGVYQADFTTGLPSTLVKDCGEVTLTGAAAMRTLASSWTTPYEGWGFLAHHANQAADMQPLSNINSTASTAVGLITSFAQNFMFGIDNTTLNLSPVAATFGAYYVDTAYGAFASTAVAPTAITTLAPIVAPYR